MGGNVSVVKGTAVFSATIIGAGILALPLTAATAGFFPLFLILFIVAIISAFSAIYISEIVLYTKGTHHLPTLAKDYLGKAGFWAMLFGIVIYIYGALIGYLSVGGQLFFALSNGFIPVWFGTLIYFAIGSYIVYRGINFVSKVETYLFSFVLILMGLIITLSLSHVNLGYIVKANWKSTFDVFGVALFAYVGHSVIPSIAEGLQKKRDLLKVAFFGTLIPFIIYVLWSFSVIGVVPSENLLSAGLVGQPATIPLGVALGQSVMLLGSIFAFLPTMTAFVGFGFSLKDVYFDVASEYKKKLTRIGATAFVVLPSLLVALLKPQGFVEALKIAGTYGGGLFVGILPILMILQMKKKKKNINIIGGKYTPYVILLIYLAGIIYTTLTFF